MTSDPLVPVEAGEQTRIEGLINDLSVIRRAVVETEGSGTARLREVAPRHRASARNLLHYLALRQFDLRPLQERLAPIGVSSLGRSEAHVLASLDAVLTVLERLSDAGTGSSASRSGAQPASGFSEGDQLLAQNAEALLGPEPERRAVRIMVTMPSEAASDYQLVRSLLAGGMNCVRINCAHDDATAWQSMIAHLRRAETELGKRCRVLMDLAGPKLRTGPLPQGPPVVKWRPRRDPLGRTVAPARIWLTGIEHPQAPPAGTDTTLPVRDAWLAKLALEDTITFRDARGRKRRLLVTEAVDRGRWAEGDSTTYVGDGTVLVRNRHGGHKPSGEPDEAVVGPLPPLEQPLLIRPGDALLLTRSQEPGHPAEHDAEGRVLRPARIACTLPEVFDDVRHGERVLLDDGKIGGIIETITEDGLLVRVSQARVEGTRLREGKGINLPDSDLHLSATTPKDIADLEFVARRADLVGLSFVHHPAAVYELQDHLEQLGSSCGIVLKIETKRAFEQLPQLLLAAMRASHAGVMIARGDLAVECGYERLAEVQEEILWLAEAAHMPVVWATQVLETLAQTGQPTRAEITDASMAQRAECVMLNKGPHVLDAVRVLDDILTRMQTHQSKKFSLLRQLRAWSTALNPAD